MTLWQDKALKDFINLDLVCEFVPADGDCAFWSIAALERGYSEDSIADTMDSRRIIALREDIRLALSFKILWWLVFKIHQNPYCIL